ncbi:MAG: DUF2500 domain-containing protein, partial [Lachnospiraceae bacterium]|nr:DUF2500 domain-containing protein [Lachnospiraceae bacterium]
MFFSPFNSFNFFNIAFFTIFFIVIAAFITVFVKGIVTWTSNNRSPLLNVNTRVVAKRVNTRLRGGHMGSDASMYMSSSAYHTYYVTFEVDSGDRMELNVPKAHFPLKFYSKNSLYHTKNIYIVHTFRLLSTL